jgi:hypothetical protein
MFLPGSRKGAFRASIVERIGARNSLSTFIDGSRLANAGPRRWSSHPERYVLQPLQEQGCPRFGIPRVHGGPGRRSRICKGRSRRAGLGFANIGALTPDADLQVLQQKDEGKQGLKEPGINSVCKRWDDGAANPLAANKPVKRNISPLELKPGENSRHSARPAHYRRVVV